MNVLGKIKTAKLLWEELAGIHEANVAASRQQVICDLATLRQGRCELVLDYFARAEEVLEKVASVGKEVSLKRRKDYILAGIDRDPISKMVWICKLGSASSQTMVPFASWTFSERS